MQDPPNILFLVLDSMRTDRVSCYGHDRKTTPYFDDLASRATRYTNAYTPAPWTLPTHTSLFTGLFPSEHGITNAFPDSNLKLTERIPTLSEKLQKKGYHTAGFSNNPWVGKTSGLDRGFGDYIEWNLEIYNEATETIHSTTDRLTSKLHSLVGHASRQPLYILKRPFFTDSLTRRASTWIKSTSTQQEPWFCFMNLMEAHSPYFPKNWAFRELGLDPPGPIEPRILNTKLLANIMGKTNLDTQTRERILEYYDASLRYQDRKLRDLIEVLRETGAFDDSLIVICSDHGKTLGGFDRTGSPPHYLRDINTRVPLVVKAPGQEEGQVVDSPLELISTHEYVVDGASRPLGEYQPDPDHALFEDFIPHTGRESPEEGATYWRGLGTKDGKFVRSDTDVTYLFSGQGFEERVVSDPDKEAQETLSAALSARVDLLNYGAADADDRRIEDLDGDVQSQLEDLGYIN